MSTYGRCRRCLLSELEGSEDILEMVDRTRKLLGDRELASREVYEQRLSVCKDCEDLWDATCRKCGCFVEIRALSREAECPVLHWRRI